MSRAASSPPMLAVSPAGEFDSSSMVTSCARLTIANGYRVTRLGSESQRTFNSVIGRKCGSADSRYCFIEPWAWMCKFPRSARKLTHPRPWLDEAVPRVGRSALPPDDRVERTLALRPEPGDPISIRDGQPSAAGDHAGRIELTSRRHRQHRGRGRRARHAAPPEVGRRLTAPRSALGLCRKLT